MKIICVENSNDNNLSEPSFYIKPDSVVSNGKQPFFHPDYTKSIVAEIGFVIKINRLGKNIETKFAHRYFNETGLAINLTATDIQQECIQKHMPWGKATAFNGSFILSKIVPVSDPDSFTFKFMINNTVIVESSIKELNFTFEKMISYLSNYMILKIGDLIFIGSDKRSKIIAINDELAGYFVDEELIRVKIK